MTSEEIYKYAGFFFIILIVIYLIIKIMKVQFNIMEGFGIKSLKSLESKKNLMSSSSSTDLSKASETITENANTLAATLDTTKKQMYEDILSSLDQSLDITLLTTILNSAEDISADPTSESSQTIMTNMNNIVSFQTAVAVAVKVVGTA